MGHDKTRKIQNMGYKEDKKDTKYVFLYNKNTNHKC